MLETIVCGTDCDSEELPPVSFDDCAPEFNKSEITVIFMALPGAADFVDESDPDEWAARLSQNGTPPAGSNTPVKDLIRQITVIADKPASTDSTYTGSNSRVAVIDRARLINVTIDETNDPNYDFMRATECGIGLPGKFWYISGPYLYGGVSGVTRGGSGQKPLLKLNQVLDRGADAVATFVGTISWGNLRSEKRTPSPFNGIPTPVNPTPGEPVLFEQEFEPEFE